MSKSRYGDMLAMDIIDAAGGDIRLAQRILDIADNYACTLIQCASRDEHGVKWCELADKERLASTHEAMERIEKG